LRRRLGDDPLTRKKKGTARAHTGKTTPVAAASDLGIPSRRSSNDVFFQRRAEENELAPPSRQEEVTEAPEADKISEISEIPALREAAAVTPVESSENAAAVEEASQTHEAAQDAETPPIPVVASPEMGTPIGPEGAVVVEAATLTEPVPLVENDGNAPPIEEPSQAHEVAQEAEAPPVPVAALPETAMPIELEGTLVAEATTQAESVPEVKAEPTDSLPAPQGPDQRDDQPQPEKSGGFFKRLFGRFGK
jgi:hypothetical protein